MPNWDYGGAYLRYPIPEQGYKFPDGSMVKVHDIFDPLPKFMYQADMMFTDPPWNLGNLNTFYSKADEPLRSETFESFYHRLFECIVDVDPKTCYVEVGKQHIADFIIEMRRIYKHVTFYNSTYYHSKDKICYVIRGSRKKSAPKLDYMDEENIIQWVCANEDYNIIGDLCMGRGLVGLHAYENGKKFVGTELNPKRLSVLIERVNKNKKGAL
ncbi:hypothetical protein DFR58_10158 [Anaerobacterium chartisolvens]|uniref:Methyltransferase n=1 Tax=Anaerobacterium chartisolvens TaxID=1297424 RepID=A0A369BJV3_9FIRM|nr:hypothetical protein [Anaerobacterium chartisolvens]RCX20856.1 hypothetical protein DFR58_10158 [Anaerobacterium chartisolvens]